MHSSWRIYSAKVHHVLCVHHTIFCYAVSSPSEPPAPVGVMGCVAGRKGPGKQSSLAFLQNPCESSDANRGVVRGVLPLELTGVRGLNHCWIYSDLEHSYYYSYFYSPCRSLKFYETFQTCHSLPVQLLSLQCVSTFLHHITFSKFL